MKVTITSIDDDETAKREGKALKELERTIKERFVKPKRDLDSLKRFILDLEKSLLSPVQRGIQFVSDKCIAWKRAQDRIAEEKRLKEQEEAEAKAKAAAEADAKAAEAANEPELAQEIREEPLNIPIPEAKPEVAHVTGVGSQGNWRAEVIGYPDDTRKFLELIVYVAQNPDQSNLLLPNQVALNKMAQAQKQGLNIPGVRAVKKEGMRWG